MDPDILCRVFLILPPQNNAMKNFIVSMLIILFAEVIVAQNGTIRGTVIDEETGETIIGANVAIMDPLTGTSTDLDGKFSISIPAGNYELQVSFISYQTKKISGVEVKAGEINNLGTIRLGSSTMELDVVEVTATATRKSEAALNTMKKKSATMMDGISAQKMELTGDATAVEAAKRVTGVSIEGGKYIYVRGLGDRYSKVTMNQMDIPGLDPDKNSLQMDIFPTNLIDNIVVSKNFTADLPADFTGGIMNVETKSFPEEKIITASASISYNPDMHFNANNLSYAGGDTDWLGYDDGTRELPLGARRKNIPRPDFEPSDEKVNSFIQRFNPTMAAERESSFMDYSLGFSLGNQIDVGSEEATYRNKLGYTFSLAYKRDYNYYDDVNVSEYQRPQDPNEYEMVLSTSQIGELSEQSVLIGGLGGLAFKTQYSKFRLTLMHLQNGVSRAAKFDIFNNADAVGQSGYVAVSDNLEYNQRSLSNVLLNGQHVLGKSGWEVDWRVSHTYSTSYDPDIRKTPFTIEGNRYFFNAGQGGLPTRIWRDLQEINLSAKVDLSKEYKLFDEDAKLKFGVSRTYKERDYEILAYDVQFYENLNQDWPGPDANLVLADQYIFPSEINGSYFNSGNVFPNSNAYNSNVNNLGLYASNEFNLTSRLKSIIGVRMENYVQRHTGRDQLYASGNTEQGNNLDNEIVLESTDFFPSVNFIYSLAEEMNLRLAYAKTIARPSFKELSFAQILDPITGRTFNGGLFEYEDWDGNLTETRIDNFDVRWEKFMDRGQIYSVSVFYKQFDDPIELIRIPQVQTSPDFQPRNVGDGRLYGIELEATKSLDMISEKLANYSLSGNVTFVESVIEMTDLEFNSRKIFEKTGQIIDNQRAMAGQAPYVINFGVTYNNNDYGLTAGIFYNVKGPALLIVGTGLIPNIYQEPYHNVNLSVNKKLGEKGNTSIDLRIANLLDDKLEQFHQSYKAEEKVFSSYSPDRSFAIGISHRF
jgi:TonB-dependent receptor